VKAPQDINVIFCRALLQAVLKDVRPRLPQGFELRDAWVYHSHFGWEFHGPAVAPGRNFYWHGEADNAFDARAKGWQAWLNQHGEV
jgi:hypothetical protein